jgi:hypothetical protein
MEKPYEITEKQLGFLEGFLQRKYPHISPEVKIELTDHLVSDFEATTENGNLSQYLSNELEFIRKFIYNRFRVHKSKYDKDVWFVYFSFFTRIKVLPLTLSTLIIFYFLSENLNNKLLWLIFFFSVFGVYGYSLFASRIKSIKIKKYEDVRFLGTGLGFGIPYLMAIFPLAIEDKDFLFENSILFTAYWFFAFSLNIAALIVMLQKKEMIIKKYKHLLN